LAGVGEYSFTKFIKIPGIPTSSASLPNHFVRIIALSNLACAARRMKFFQKAIDALAEAVET
jgi:hypothetical protein